MSKDFELRRQSGDIYYSNLQMGNCPPSAELVEQLKNWQIFYRNSTEYFSIRKLRLRTQNTTSQDPKYARLEAYTKCCQNAHNLKQSFNKWLSSESFISISNFIRNHLQLGKENVIILQTDNHLLRQLPWSEWNLFNDFTQTKLVFGSSTIKKLKSFSLVKKLKVLVIAGYEVEDLEIDIIKTALNTKAKITICKQPTIQDLDNLLWQKKWNIIIYLGHGQTTLEGQNGVIQINALQWLNIEHIKNHLQKAINNGLQLAIFNCCDGLGIANQLIEGNQPLPQIIVMQDLLPTAKAPEIIKNLLENLIKGKSPSACVWEEQKRLKAFNGCSNLLNKQPCELDNLFPCIDWLPVIFSNSIEAKIALPEIPSAYVELSLSLAIALIFIIIRSLGLLQGSELKFFDLLMRLRPPEPADTRLLLVTVTEEDIIYQDKMEWNRKGSLSEAALTKLLIKLNDYKGRVIGLDIYGNTINPEYPQLINQLQNRNLIAICKIRGEGNNNYSVSPPPQVSVKNLGFNDVPVDFDRVIRRHFLGMSNDSACPTTQSLSYQVVRRYINTEPSSIKIKANEDLSQITIGETILKPLSDKNAGGYKLSTNQIKGFQLLINYRSTNQIAPEITLQEILEETDPNKLKQLIENKIVLIGTTAQSYKDFHSSPLSEDTSGIVINAHIISQLLSAVFEGRPLIWWWSESVENLWILAWSLIGGVIVWRQKDFLIIVVSLFGSLIVLSSVCYIFLLFGGWIPLIPSASVLFLSTSVITVYNKMSYKRP